jgi:hypothetical protein
MSMRFWSGKLQIYEAIFVPEFNQDGHRAKKRTVSNETVHGVINQRERSLPSTAYQ